MNISKIFRANLFGFSVLMTESFEWENKNSNVRNFFLVVQINPYMFLNLRHLYDFK